MFVEWLWRSVKYERVYLMAYDIQDKDRFDVTLANRPFGGMVKI